MIMKNVQVQVMENGEVKVVGINKDGSVSKVDYTVVEVIGLKEFGLKAMQAGVEKQFNALKETAVKAEVKEQPTVYVKPNAQARVKETVNTKGKQFTNFKQYGTRAVAFTTPKGECTVGFAKDKNVFMEHFNGNLKETTKAEVLRRLSKYQGYDAKNLVKIVKDLKPVSMVADYCTGCGSEVTHRVKDFSIRHFGKVLCRTCQPNDGGTKTTGKAPERSEGATAPQLGAGDKGACLKCGVEENVHTYCLPCHKELEAEEQRSYWEDICECGAEKERAFEYCVECRENKWAESDAVQDSLFETLDDRLAYLSEKNTCDCGKEKPVAVNMCNDCADEAYIKQMEKQMEEMELSGFWSANGVSASTQDEPIGDIGEEFIDDDEEYYKLNPSKQNVGGVDAAQLDEDTLQQLGV